MSKEEKWGLVEVQKFKRAVRNKVAFFERAINCAEPEELEAMMRKLLSPRNSLVFIPLKKKIQGPDRIIAFWLREKKRGMTRFRLEVEDIAIEPFNRIEMRDGEPWRFNARGLVIGRYSYVRKEITAPPSDPGGPFTMEFCHRDDCSWDLEGEVFY